jgi:glutathione synthase/RimK-type ligase-like ATP-grasp enzyme
MFSKLIKYTLMLIYLVRKTSFKGFTFRETDNIVWMKIWGLKLFKEDEFIDYMAVIDSLSRHGVKFNISVTNKIGRFSKKNIFLRYSRGLDPFKFSNYTQTLYFVCKQLEDQKCTVYPGSAEVLYWENKGFMTQKFFEYNISAPKTLLITDPTEITTIDLAYPFLIKEEHSSSSDGLHKISHKEDLNKFFKENDYFSGSKFLIAQELLDMRRDLRVILVGDKIVHYYWRINRSDQWRPTASSFGNDIDFGSFPEQWREFIIDQFKRFNIHTGAFDIAWRNDDLSTLPLILEVSPNYQPNPAVDVSHMKISYSQFKEKLLFRNSYYNKFVDIVFSIMDEQILLFIKSNKK